MSRRASRVRIERIGNPIHKPRVSTRGTILRRTMAKALDQLRIVLRALVIDFENRDLGLLGAARIGLSFASWSFAIALGVYGFEAHGVVGAGLVADRFPRRTVLLASAALMAAILAGAAIAAGLDAPTGVVFVFPALFAVASSGYAPAEAAMFPLLARTPQELSASNVNHSAM